MDGLRGECGDCGLTLDDDALLRTFVLDVNVLLGLGIGRKLIGAVGALTGCNQLAVFLIRF